MKLRAFDAVQTIATEDGHKEMPKSAVQGDGKERPGFVDTVAVNAVYEELHNVAIQWFDMQAEEQALGDANAVAAED